jgi:hypothetical protein
MTFQKFLEPVEEIKDEKRKPNFTNFLEEVKEPESTTKSILRQTGQYALRGAEGFLGVPGDIADVAGRVSEWGARQSGQTPYKSYEEKKAAEEKDPLDFKIPTTSKLRQYSKDIFGDTFEPKTRAQEVIGQTAEDIGSFLFPLGGQVKLLRPVLTAVGKNVAGLGGEAIGGEKAKNYTELGSLFMMGLLKRPKINELRNSLYEQSRLLRDEKDVVNASDLSKSISKIEKDLLKGSPTAVSKASSLKTIKEIKSKIKDKNIAIGELEEFKKDINEAASNAKIWQEGATSGKRNKTSLKLVGKEIDNAIEQYGKKNPEYLKKYRDANKVASAIYRGEDASNFIEHALDKTGKGVSDLTKTIFLIQHPIFHLASFGKGIVKPPYKILTHVFQSPDLQKHYLGILRSVSRENVAVTSKLIQRFDEKIKKDKNFKDFLEEE